MGQIDPTQAHALRKTPLNFYPGEFCLIAQAADRFGQSATWIVEHLPERRRNEDDDWRGKQASIAVRRWIHYGLDLEDLSHTLLECTAERVYFGRLDYFAELGSFDDGVLEWIASLGRRWMWSYYVEQGGLQ